MEKQKNIPQLRFSEFEREWERTCIRSVSKKITDGTHDTPFPTEQGVPYLTAIHIKDGFIDYENCYYLPQEVHDIIYSRCNPEFNDLLLVNIGAGTANCALNTVNYEFSLKNVALIKPNKEKVIPSFLEQVQRLNRERLFLQLTSGGAQPFLSLKEIGKIKITIPSLPEQQKIASFFTAIDHKISQLKRKKTLLEQYKKGVMQKIFSQKIRFKDDNGQEFPKWENKRLGEFLVHKSLRNKNNITTLVLSVSNTRGFIAQSDQFDNHRVASADTSNYKIVRLNDFAYNPSRINVGSIARLTNYSEGIVSPMYVVFGFKPNLDAGYFENLIKTHKFNFLVKTSCSGSVRDSLNFDDLCEFVFNFPSLPEQTKIANFLSAIDGKITHTQNQIEKAEVWKKGLMHQMFV